MAKKFFTEVAHPAVVQEHEGIYISGDGREIVAEANAVAERASRTRLQRMAGFVIDALAQVSEASARMNGLGYLYDYGKRDEDELNANQ